MHSRTRIDLRKGWMLPVAVGIGFSVGLLAAQWSGAEESSTRTARAARSSSAGSSASDSDKKLAQLERKLDEVLATQQTILQKFDAVMEELRIIKVRATIRAGS